MANIIISIGVHRTEVDAQKYGEAFAEKLQQLGNHVIVVKRPDSSTREVLEFNTLKTILGIIHAYQIGRGIQGQPSEWMREYKAFFDKLSKSHKEFLEKIMQRRDVRWIFDVHRFEERNAAMSENGITLARRLFPLFEKRPKLFQLGKTVQYTGAAPDDLATQYVNRYGDVAYRQRLARKYPEYHIIDLHNSPPPKIQLKSEYQLIGRHFTIKERYPKKRTRQTFTTVELITPTRKMPHNRPHSRRFFEDKKYKGSKVVRFGTTQYEISYGTTHFPHNPQKPVTQKEITAIAQKLHHEISTAENTRRKRKNPPRTVIPPRRKKTMQILHFHTPKTRNRKR